MPSNKATTRIERFDLSQKDSISKTFVDDLSVNLGTSYSSHEIYTSFTTRQEKLETTKKCPKGILLTNVTLMINLMMIFDEHFLKIFSLAILQTHFSVLIEMHFQCLICSFRNKFRNKECQVKC